MIRKFSIEKKWNIEDFYKLNYFLTTHKDEKLINQYHESGHSLEMMTLYNYHEPSPMPNIVHDFIKPQFSFLDSISIGVNLFKPGQYLPVHTDLFGKYIKVHNVDYDKIVRYILMLENSEDGQILQIENSLFTGWVSGDCFGWSCSEKHAFYNFSIKNRYAIQITGVLK